MQHVAVYSDFSENIYNNNYKIQKALQVDCSHYTVLYLLENYSNNTIIILIFVRLFFSEMLYDIYTMSTNMIFTRY